MTSQWPGPGKKRYKISRRQITLIELYFGRDFPASRAAFLAGYKGRSTAALCNTAQRVLLRFLEDPQAFINAMKVQKLRDWHLQNLRTLREKIEREKGLKS
jgi:hypothetical protein